jgi:hypothetical protein
MADLASEHDWSGIVLSKLAAALELHWRNNSRPRGLAFDVPGKAQII